MAGCDASFHSLWSRDGDLGAWWSCPESGSHKPPAAGNSAGWKLEEGGFRSLDEVAGQGSLDWEGLTVRDLWHALRSLVGRVDHFLKVESCPDGDTQEDF